MNEKQYDVALSFAWEDRGYAEHLAKLLTGGGYSIFNDTIEREKLWGKIFMFTYLLLIQIRRVTASYSFLNAMHRRCGRNMSSRALRLGHLLRRTEKKFCQSGLTTQRCQNSF